MEARLIKLEEFATDTRERLATIALRLEQTATKTDIADIRADMHKASTDIARWMITTVIGLFLGFGGLFFVVTNSTKNSTAPPTPIIIYAQPTAASPPLPNP
jgi:hypothetical protein